MEVEEAPVFAADLKDRLRPVAGGVQVQTSRESGGVFSRCTLGFNLEIDNIPGEYFATNGHCTEEWGEVDGTLIGQNSYPQDVIGEEFWEEKSFDREDNPDCMVSFDPRCKWTEIAIGDYDVPTESFGKGLIYRPVNRDPLMGSTEIDANATALAINTVQLWPNLGETVEKVGRTTGWTFGPVTETCKTQEVFFPNNPLVYYIFCSYTAGAGGQAGDSGAAVLKNLSGDWADIVGQLYGVQVDQIFFTPWNNIAVIVVAPQSLSDFSVDRTSHTSPVISTRRPEAALG